MKEAGATICREECRVPYQSPAGTAEQKEVLCTDNQDSQE